MAMAYLRVSLLMGIPIPHTLVQTSKISIGSLSKIVAALYITGRDSRLKSVIAHPRCLIKKEGGLWHQRRKKKNLKRSNIITLKLTDIELAVLNEATGITGLSRSEYLRKLLLAPFAHSFASTSELLPPRKLVDMINTFFATIKFLLFQRLF